MSVAELQNRISQAFTEDILIQIVKAKTGWEEVFIKNIILDESETKKGDSYLSTITRFKVEASKKACSCDKAPVTTIAVITKAIPKNVARRKTFRSNDFFPNEINFFEIVWHTLQEFIKSKNVKSKMGNILPLCLASLSDGENDFVALEDASFSGFEGIDRSNSLDLEHTKLIIKCFATFHGISFAYKQQHPEDFKRIMSTLKETYFHENFRNWYIRFQANLLGVIRDCIERQLPEKYVKKFDEMTSGDLYGDISAICARETPFSVATHGDAWVPNFLMKYDESRNPVTPLMIDFQLARYSSLGLDLIFFMYTCVDHNILADHYDYLLEEYLGTFHSVMKELGTDPNLITLDNVKEEIRAAGVFGVGMSMEAIVMCLLDDDEVADIDNIQGEDAVPLETIWVLHPFKSEEKRVRIANILKHAVDNGFI